MSTHSELRGRIHFHAVNVPECPSGNWYEKGKKMAEEVTNEVDEGAKKKAEEVTNEVDEGAKKFDVKNLGMGAWIGIAVAALIIGVLIGKFALGGGAGAALNKTTLTEQELDTVVANYSDNGAAKNITARQVIEMTSSLESSKDESGNYTVPSADNILYAVRNTIAIGEAEKRGINPSDEDLLNYAEKTLGQTPDFESIATSNNIDVNTVKKLLTDSYRISELQKQVGGEMSVTEPEMPKEPEYKTTKDDGSALSDDEIKKNQEEAYNKTSADYAKYIINLAGDEWDAQGNKWKSEDGPYAQALASYDVKNDSANYLAAYAAYQTAYSKYSEAQSEYMKTVTDYLGNLYGNSSINILTLKQ